jgi:hypothetical protein
MTILTHNFSMVVRRYKAKGNLTTIDAAAIFLLPLNPFRATELKTSEEVICYTNWL